MSEKNFDKDDEEDSPFLWESCQDEEEDFDNLHMDIEYEGGRPEGTISLEDLEEEENNSEYDPDNPGDWEYLSYEPPEENHPY